MGWIAAQSAAAAGLHVAGWWGAHPDLSLGLVMAAGVIGAVPEKWWAAPLIAAGTILAGLALGSLDLPPVVGIGAVAGLACALVHPTEKDSLDIFHAAMAGATGAGIGLWLAERSLGPPWVGLAEAAGTAAMIAVPAALALYVVVLRPGLRRRPGVHLLRGLAKPYHPPVLQALDFGRRATRTATDRQTRAGVDEVVEAVARLQRALQADDDAIRALNPEDIQARIRACEDVSDVDAFTAERRAATADHLRRTLDLRANLAVERARTAALVDHALAFLEEAAVGLALAKDGGREGLPDRLPLVLDRLRSDARGALHRRSANAEVERTAGQTHPAA
jgi:hypothetical protein